MNTDIFEGKWKQFKGQAQQKWGELTQDDLDSAEGDQQVLIGKIQEKYGKTKAEAEKEVNDWLASL